MAKPNQKTEGMGASMQVHMGQTPRRRRWSLDEEQQTEDVCLPGRGAEPI